MDKSYCQFINSGGSWLSFPEPEEDSESEGIFNAEFSFHPFVRIKVHFVF